MYTDNKIPEHGGVISSDMLDFSANLNPLGMPENVREALERSVGDWERYPDPVCKKLTDLLSQRLVVPEKNIVCGNGAADLIYRIIGAVKPKRALIAEPCFSEYGKAIMESGAEVLKYKLFEETDFAVGADLIKTTAVQLTGGDMLILASPNNPTGRVIPKKMLQKLCGLCESREMFFLCDESFFDLTEASASVLEFLNPYVIMLSSFTKTFALAGLRLGYAVFGDEGLAEKVRRRGQYWSVSSPAQTAGIAALDPVNNDYLERSRKLVFEQRKFLTEELSRLGIEVFPSDTNFLLLKTELPLYDMLCGQGIIIRRCANFNRLNENFYRIAVRAEDENKRLISALEGSVNG